MTAATLEDRVLGCLLGGALGDAFGACFEGCAPQQIVAEPAHLRITDDTQLTIATCEAIANCNGVVDPNAIAENFLQWFRQRRFTGLGSATLKALTELDAGGHWALVGATGERAAGNGAAMRIAPVGFLIEPDVDRDRQTIRDVCRITHRNDEAYVGATLAMVRSLRQAIDSHSFEQTNLSQLAESLPDSRVRDRLSIVACQPLTIEEYSLRFGTSGYVVDAVPCALLAATSKPPLLTTLRRIVRCGGDTDSIAALCGQVVGACGGQAVIPDVVERIEDLAMIRESFAKFAALVASISRAENRVNG